MKVAQQPQKPPSGSNQIWATTSDKKDTATDLRGHCIRLCSCCCYQTYRSKVATYVRYICCCCCAVVNNNLIEVGSFDNMSQETHTKEKGLEFYLINNRRMFNVEIDDLAKKPYPRARSLRSPRSGIPSTVYTWDARTPTIKYWPSTARIFYSWTLYYISLTSGYTILSCTSFSIPPKNVDLKALL